MKNSTLFFLFSLFISSLSAQNETTKSDLEQLTDSIEILMEKNRIPGLMLTLVTADSVIYDAGLGLANLEEERPVDATQLFRLGSITKSFAALAMLRLEAEGKFSLQDKLADVAPEIPFKNKWKDTHPVLLVHLLEHSAGFDDMHFNAVYNWGKKELATLDMVHKHKNSLVTRWKPGTRMSYANPGYVIVGYLIEKFSGKTYHDYIKEIIFDPIGMEHSNMTSFPDMKLHAQGYKHQDGSFNPVPFYTIHGGIAGTLNSCGKDMARFLQFFLNNGKSDSLQVFPKSALEKMETPTSTLAARNGKKQGYGLANAKSFLDEPFPFNGHGGGIDGFSSIYGYNRALGVGFAMSNNANGGTNAIESLVINYLTKDFDIPELDAIPMDKDLAKSYEGYYHHKSPRNQFFYLIENIFSGIKLSSEGDTLLIKGFMEDPQKYVQVENRLFRNIKLNTPTLLLTENEQGDKVIIGRNYYENSSSSGILFKRIWFFTAALFSLIASIFGIVWCILLILKKANKQVNSTALTLSISAFGFMLFFISMIFSLEDFTTLGMFNGLNLGVYLASIIFALGAILGVVFLFKNYKKIEKGLLKLYLILTCFALFTLAYYFFQHGMIGIKLWTF